MRLTDTTDARAFLSFTDRHYDARFIPPLHATVRAWQSQGVRLCLLEDGGEVIGRTTLHTSAAFDAKLGRSHQLFGLTEFAEGAGEALFDAICAEGAGKDAVFGPVSLLPNQAGGVITSGFEERGFIDSAWNHPYYAVEYDKYGFRRRFESDTWICPIPDEPVFAFDDARIAAEDLRVHRGSRRRFREQLPILRGMLNASFAGLGYYTEISAEQLADQTDGLAFLLDEALLLYLTKAGEPIAFVLCVPDISEFVARIGGNLHLLNQLRLLAGRSRYRREAVLIIKGTIPREQGRGYMNLLSRELHDGLRAGGYRALRSTYVERTNPGSAAQYRAMGGRPLHGYTFYDKDLG